MSIPMRIAVVGGNGGLGRLIVPALCAPPAAPGAPKFEVTTLARPGGSSDTPAGKRVLQDLRDAGSKVVLVPLDDEAALVSELQGSDLVVNVIPVWFDDVQRPLIRAVAGAGIRHVIPADFGADSSEEGPNGADPIYAKQRQAVRDMQAAGLAPHNVHTGFFFDRSLIPPFGFDFAKGEVTIIGDGEVPADLSCSSDVGGYLAAWIRGGGMEAGDGVLRLRSESLTAHQVVKTVEEVTGKPIKVTYRALADVKSQGSGMSDPDAFWVMWAEGRLRVGKPANAAYPEVPGTSLREWVRRDVLPLLNKA